MSIKKPSNRAILESQSGPAESPAPAAPVRVRTRAPIGEHPPGVILTLSAAEAEQLGAHVQILAD